MYISRELERKFLSMNQVFKAVLVTGARQVGKSTMLKHLARESDRAYVTLDSVRDRELAQKDPVLFLQTYRPPVLIDEVQKAPELFEAIKVICDATNEKGLFWLTGSQSKKLLKQAGDSLAGRVCILKMYSLSVREQLGLQPKEPLDFSYTALMQRQRYFPANNIHDTFERIWRGGMPDVQMLDEEQLQEYFSSYIETYLMRDAVEDNGITNTVGFRKFLRACAAFNGQLLNYTDLAASAEINLQTAKEWVRILQNMGIIYLLEPYANNELKRLIKTPKLYFCDTGLCAYLSMWTTKDTLMNGAVSGHYYENHILMELVRNYAYGKEKANLTFYRDTHQKEVDIFLEESGMIHPFEIKKAAHPDRKEVKKFELIEKSNLKRGPGGIICMCDSPFPIDELNTYIPGNII